MNENMKVGMAVLGGYVLGRTKKGGLALRLAMMAAGVNPRDMVKDNLAKALKSPDAAKIATELTAPLIEALRAAAMSTVENRVNGVADSLAQRTAGLRSLSGGGAEGKQDSGSETGQPAGDGAEKSGTAESGNQGRESDGKASQSSGDDNSSSGTGAQQSGGGQGADASGSAGSADDAGRNQGGDSGEDERATPDGRTPDSDRAAPQRSADASR